MIFFLKLLLAHTVADFLLQPDRWVIDKEQRKFRSPRLYAHVLLHGVLTWLLVWDAAFWAPALVLVVSHYCIDLTKVAFQRPDNRPRWFAIDQSLHLIVLIALWYVWEKPALPPTGFPLEIVLVIATAAVLLTHPTSVVIRMTIAHWTPDTLPRVSASLPDAGKFIGYLERLLILIFILFDHWEAVGFLLAAKSVFRFGDLRESQDRKLTEYVLIGTLLSFGIALIISLMCVYIIRSMA